LVISVENPEGRRSLQRSKPRWKEIIKIDIKDIDYVGVPAFQLGKILRHNHIYSRRLEVYNLKYKRMFHTEQTVFSPSVTLQNVTHLL
jgi:hypothetical protein